MAEVVLKLGLPPLEGFLLKKGAKGITLGWKRRWFVLADQRLLVTQAAWAWAPLERILDYLRHHLNRNWATVGRTQIKDDTLGLLALIEKSHRAGAGR